MIAVTSITEVSDTKSVCKGPLVERAPYVVVKESGGIGIVIEKGVVLSLATMRWSDQIALCEHNTVPSRPASTLGHS